jgi:hypothetical protein
LIVVSPVTSTVIAASPAPSASAAADPGAYPNLEAWLDRAIGADARPGSTIPVGLTIWDSQQGQFLVISGLYLKLHPATGKARPTEAEIIRSDWPGHFLANVIAPDGGPGAIEVVVRDGNADLPIRLGGVGPPPTASLSSLVAAHVQLPSEPAIAGRPFDLVVAVRTLVDWDPPVSLPDRMIVIATLGRGPELTNTEIRAVTGSPTTFAGPITIPKAGNVALDVGFPGGPNGADEFFQTVRLQVGSEAASTPGEATPVVLEGGVPWPLIAGGIALVLAAVLVIRRVFADL